MVINPLRRTSILSPPFLQRNIVLQPHHPPPPRPLNLGLVANPETSTPRQQNSVTRPQCLQHISPTHHGKPGNRACHWFKTSRVDHNLRESIQIGASSPGNGLVAQYSCRQLVFCSDFLATGRTFTFIASGRSSALVNYSIHAPWA